LRAYHDRLLRVLREKVETARIGRGVSESTNFRSRYSMKMPLSNINIVSRILNV